MSIEHIFYMVGCEVMPQLSESRSRSSTCVVVERPDHQCGDDLVKLHIDIFCKFRDGNSTFDYTHPFVSFDCVSLAVYLRHY